MFVREGGLALLGAPDQSLDGVAFVVDDEDQRRGAGFDHGSDLLDCQSH